MRTKEGIANLNRVGAAAIIDLVGQEGIADRHFLELRRLSDGTVSVEVVAQPGVEGQGAQGTTSLISFAGALAKKNPLRVETADGYYGLERRHESVEIEHHVWESGLTRRWRGSLADLLNALKDLGSRAA